MFVRDEDVVEDDDRIREEDARTEGMIKGVLYFGDLMVGGDHGDPPGFDLYRKNNCAVLVFLLVPPAGDADLLVRTRGEADVRSCATHNDSVSGPVNDPDTRVLVGKRSWAYYCIYWLIGQIVF